MQAERQKVLMSSIRWSAGIPSSACAALARRDGLRIDGLEAGRAQALYDEPPHT